MSGIEWMLVSPILAAVGGAVLALVADAFGMRRLSVTVVGTALFAASGLAVWGVYASEGGTLVAEVVVLGVGFSAIVAIVMALAGLSVAGGAGYFASTPRGPASAVLIVISAAAASVLAVSLDLAVTLIALETVAVAAYALTVAGRTPRALESSMKYLIQGAISTGMMLVAIAVLYGVYGGDTGYTVAAEGIAKSPLALPAALAMILMIAAFSFKLGAFPFHSWAPDVFETAPAANAAFMSAGPKVAAASGLFVAMWVMFPAADAMPAQLDATLVISILAAASILYGNLAALKQTSYSRMLGYSGIAQVGYVLVGLVAGLATAFDQSAVLSYTSVLMLVSVYGLAVTGAFLGAWALSVAEPEWDGSIAGMAGMGRKYPLLGFGIAATMLSLTGIPLTAGFWGKFYVFLGTVQASQMWIVVVGVLGSVVSFGYYGRVLRAMYFEPLQEREAGDEEPRRVPAVGVFVVGMLVVVVGVLPALVGTEPILRFFAVG